ncbi:MAG: hypothetical protein AAF602_02985 [Myxococcota bacterium]
MFALALLLAGPAHAQVVNATLCFEYDVNYSDTDIAALSDDYITSDIPHQPARDAVVHIENDTLTWLGDIVVTLNSSGCATVGLQAVWRYTLKLRAEGTTDGVDWEVVGPGGGVYVNFAATNWQPVASPPTFTTGVHPAWNIVSTIRHSLERINVPSAAYTFHDSGCPGSTGAASCERSPDIWIDPSHDDNKYIIAHELGHAVMESCNNERDENLDGGGTGGNCTSAARGNLAKKEYQSNAANEGAAWYYSALTFNRRTDNDCQIARCLDHNATGFCTTTELYPSCEGLVSEPWSNLDYLGSHCTGTLTGRAVRFDYVRAFWDLTQDAPNGSGQGLIFPDVCDLWLEARPDTWDANGGGSSGNDPETRLRDAADALGFLTEWDNVDNANGIHR